MDGVVVFADNKVLEAESFENQLFNKLKNDGAFPILPICSIEELETTIKTISTCKALILDWNFDRDDEGDLEGVKLPVHTPEEFLKNVELYSLIYVYSQNEIGAEIRQDLQNRFPDKIQFKTKAKDAEVDNDVHNIKKDIEEFEISHKHMEIPFIWSRAINQAAQKLFRELEQADPNWIKEIRDTIKSDGGEPTSEIIDIFHHILNESLIQNPSLRSALDQYDCDKQNMDEENTTKKEENTAKLYRRIYYSYISKETPIMTGDIFKFDDDKYGVLITPECEVNTRKDICLDFLIFSEKDMNEYLQKNNTYDRENDKYIGFKDSKKKKIREIYNNESLSIHILPSFPFEDAVCNKSACINFKTGFSIKKNEEYINKRTNYKLNVPYIHQLRQRYVSFFGRYGVPAMPNSLRDFNLK